MPPISLSPGDRQALDRNVAASGGLSVPSGVDLLAKFDRLDRRDLPGYEPEQLREPGMGVECLVPRGMSWLPDSYYPFLIKYRTHPFVSPADPRLQSTVVPLGVDGASYELTKRYLEAKELPPPELVRTEDFLAAAVDYGFPQPAGQALGLSMAAGPSPFGGEGLWLLQVGVQARHVTQPSHPPLYLVLAVDTSANMRWGGRMEMVRRALTGLGGQLGPRRPALAGRLRPGGPRVDRRRGAGRGRPVRRRGPLVGAPRAAAIWPRGSAGPAKSPARKRPPAPRPSASSSSPTARSSWRTTRPRGSGSKWPRRPPTASSCTSST